MSLTVKSLDQVEVQVTYSDAGLPPDAPKGGQRLNTQAVWFKVGDNPWRRSTHRSAIKTSDFIRHNNSTELISILCDKEPLNEGTETSSGGCSSGVNTELQSLQGHSSSDADKGSTGES